MIWVLAAAFLAEMAAFCACAGALALYFSGEGE